MSFVFPRPVPKTRNSSVYSVSDHDFYSGDDFDFHGNHLTLIHNPEPDYDELLFRLSLYAFTGLSPREQQEQVEEIKVEDVLVEQGPEESDEAFRTRTFAELFMKLPYSDQLELFLSKVIQKFKSERQLEEFISSFKQLDTDHQQQLIEESAVHLAPKNILMLHGETEEDFRLRQFTQLCRDHTDYVYKLLLINIHKSEDDEQEETSGDNESSSDWKYCFADFFSGFSAIWFKGQSKRGQDLLIEQLSNGVIGVTINNRLLRDETEEDFKLRKFTELCKKVTDFKVQVRFLHFAELKLREWGHDDSKRLIVEPQDSESAAKLLSRLATFGFRLLSAKYQQQKIEEMSKQVEGFPIESRLAVVEASIDAQEDIRVKTFTELFDQVPVPTQIDLFEELKRILLQQKHYSEAVHFFKGLCCEDQTEMIDKLFGYDSELVIKKFSGESEEDFRLRRFSKVCVEHLSALGYIDWRQADRERVREATSDYNEEYSPYAKFLFDVSLTWFKARCANYWRNPIHVILLGEVEIRDEIEKLPEENEENFRLRRFTESFKQLKISSQERIVNYIKDGLFGDLKVQSEGTSLLLRNTRGYAAPATRPQLLPPKPPPPPPPACPPSPEGRGPFDSEWIAMEEISILRDQGGAAAANTRGAAAANTRGAGGTAATTQAGAGSGRDPGNRGYRLSDMCLIC